jgi:nucleotide-binding universal stress UspA family protein
MKLFSTNRVLVPIDFSEESFQALNLTLEYLENPANLYVIHVLSNLNPGEPGLVWEKINDQTRINHVKEAFQKRFHKAEDKAIHFEVKIGDPSAEIIDFANKNKLELIVIPSHGRTGMGRFFLGSVAEKVVRFAHCPVLVLRRKDLVPSTD